MMPPDTSPWRGDARIERLIRTLEELESVLIAFSGGVDSTFLLYWAHRMLGTERVLAVTLRSPVFPRREFDDAREFAETLGVRHRVEPVDLLALPAFRENPADRCYHCKRVLFSRLLKIARDEKMQAVCDGTNADDGKDYRPGRRALRELGVRSPLAEAGLGKPWIRQWSRRLGLPTAGKPSGACLATRFPYGVPIVESLLVRVSCAEDALHALDFHTVRVRVHGDAARIELDAEDFARALAQRDAIVLAVKTCGFRYVALDMEGYRTGSMNEVLAG